MTLKQNGGAEDARVDTTARHAEGAGGRGKDFFDLRGATGREVNFRPRRYSASELMAVLPVVYLREETGPDRRCEVLDASLSGVAFFAEDDVVFCLNQEIPEIAVVFDRYEAYRGRARVTSIREQDGRTLFAATFLDGLLNVEAVCRLRDIKTDQEETVRKIVEATGAWRMPSHLEFKGVMAEYRLFLETVRAHLSELEPRIPWHVLHSDDEDPARNALMELLKRDLVEPYVAYLTRLDDLMRQVEGNDHEALKSFARSTLHEFTLEAPLFRRSYEKPLGYAGDYVIMTFIYGRDFEGTTLFGKYAHLAAWHIPVCRAVRSRARYVAGMLADLVDSRKGSSEPVRILSVASGPAQELSHFLSRAAPGWPPLHVVLFDQDQHSLDLCYRHMARSPFFGDHAQNRVTYLHDSIKHLLFEEGVFGKQGPFDAIICCGLYDYLPMNVAQNLTAKLYRNLAPGGRAFIGNMAPCNPSRFTMEYLAEWYLIYRNKEEVLSIGDLVPREAARAVLEEPTGINYFLALDRA